MKRILLMILAVSLLLTGCSWLDGSYLSVNPHQEQQQSSQSEIITASDYLDLMSALEEMVSSGTESGVIYVTDYPPEAVDSGMAVAVRHILENFPLGAYAVEEISYEVGSNSGLPAMAVNITYGHSRMEIQMISQAANMSEAETVILDSLEDFDAGVVLLVEEYHDLDFTQLVEDYAEEHPEAIMETPTVTAGVYGSGKARVVELTFTYQNSRDSLRQMQNQVKPVFDSAVLYVSGDGADRQKYYQLYAFLMERFDYQVDTSITPSYSLLRHGVGDSRAFAVVYAAMCRQAGLECMVVTGTCSGEPRTWNIVLDGGNYYHVDLLRCNELGAFREFTDNEMAGYVWDYSAYPKCPAVYVASEETDPAELEETVPEETEEVTVPAETEEISEDF